LNFYPKVWRNLTNYEPPTPVAEEEEGLNNENE